MTADPFSTLESREPPGASLSQHIWARYGGSPGMVRTQAGLGIYRRTEGMARGRLPLLDQLVQRIPAAAPAAGSPTTATRPAPLAGAWAGAALTQERMPAPYAHDFSPLSPPTPSPGKLLAQSTAPRLPPADSGRATGEFVGEASFPWAETELGPAIRRVQRSSPAGFTSRGEQSTTPPNKPVPEDQVGSAIPAGTGEVQADARGVAERDIARVPGLAAAADPGFPKLPVVQAVVQRKFAALDGTSLAAGQSPALTQGQPAVFSTFQGEIGTRRSFSARQAELLLPIQRMRSDLGSESAGIQSVETGQEMNLVDGRTVPAGGGLSPVETGGEPPRPETAGQNARPEFQAPESQADIEVLVEKVLRRLLRRFAIEGERRGWQRWP